ncbi:hypothetical protein J007_05563 [Cryptococcus neoformans]|nr:hypothetical protein C356_05638 [Cryptococcus neoformans var. grubii c45]OXB34755.1 hypothetical protein J007_05563 [Cryptococcus neoformans var. grubii]OXC58880.1 hypothetical protein C358_05680 [Cryptococcus neoformans var. grubii MW-RSA852]
MMMAPKLPEDPTSKPVRFSNWFLGPNRTLSISRHIPPVRVEYEFDIPQ